MSAASRVRHLLMDLDGTLLESRDLPARMEFVLRTLGGLRRRVGLVRTLRALRAVRMAVESPCADRSPERTNAARASASFARVVGLPFEEADRLLRAQVSEVFPLLERHFYPVEGAREFLDWASGRYTLRLATNPVWPIEQVEARVRWAGIDPQVFEAITHSGRMHATKPHAEYYEELLEQESLAAADCLLVGDDIRKDLPATRVGIPVFILTGRGSNQPRPATGLRPLEIARMRGPAWAGSYAHLRALLGGSA